MKTRSLFKDVNIDELQSILELNELPSDVGLDELMDEEYCDEFFDIRKEPAKMARKLLRKQGVEVKEQEIVKSLNASSERLEIEKAKLELRRSKQESQANVTKQLKDIMLGVNMLIGAVAEINKRLSEIERRLSC